MFRLYCKRNTRSQKQIRRTRRCDVTSEEQVEQLVQAGACSVSEEISGNGAHTPCRQAV